MKITDLAEHLHQTRYQLTSGTRAVGVGMSASEAWSAVNASTITTVDHARVLFADLPPPIWGTFSRIRCDQTAIGVVYVAKSAPKEWVDFIIVKELMHCFTPMKRRCATEEQAAEVLGALVGKRGPFPAPLTTGDMLGAVAAAEVMLPHKTVEGLRSQEIENIEIASRHGLYKEVVDFTTLFEVMQLRKNASL